MSFSKESKLNILNENIVEGECAIAFLSGLFHSNGELSMKNGKWQGSIVTEIKELFPYVDEIVKRLYGEEVTLQIEDNYVINKTTYYSISFPEMIAERILVDCGILSNPQEAELLKVNKYRQKLAFAIYTGNENYFNNLLVVLCLSLYSRGDRFLYFLKVLEK